MQCWVLDTLDKKTQDDSGRRTKKKKIIQINGECKARWWGNDIHKVSFLLLLVFSLQKPFQHIKFFALLGSQELFVRRTKMCFESGGEFRSDMLNRYALSNIFFWVHRQNFICTNLQNISVPWVFQSFWAKNTKLVCWKERKSCKAIDDWTGQKKLYEVEVMLWGREVSLWGRQYNVCIWTVTILQHHHQSRLPSTNRFLLQLSSLNGWLHLKRLHAWPRCYEQKSRSMSARFFCYFSLLVFARFQCLLSHVRCALDGASELKIFQCS